MMFRKRQAARLAALLLAVAALVGLDQWTKQLAEAYLQVGVVRPLLSLGPLGDVCYLTLAHNAGAFLSLGAGLEGALHLAVMVLVPLVALAAILFLLSQPVWKASAKPLPAYLQAIFALALAGGSNIFDRAVHGVVTDYLNFGVGTLRTGIMNLADLYIMAAVVVALVAVVRMKPAGERK